MGWKWQKRFSIFKYGYLMLTFRQGFGLGFVYHPCSLAIWLGPLVIDMTVPTPMWWRIIRHYERTKNDPLVISE